MQQAEQAPDSVPGFFKSLYDLSFTEFVTPRMVRIIYIIALVAAALWCVGLLFGGFSTLGVVIQMQNSPYGQNAASSSLGVLGLGEIVGAPILFIVFSIAARMQLEVLIAIFRIAENTTLIARDATAQGTPPP